MYRNSPPPSVPCRAPRAERAALAALAISLAGVASVLLQGCGSDGADGGNNAGFLNQTQAGSSQNASSQLANGAGAAAADLPPALMAFLERPDARVQAGGDVQLYVVSSSNAVWMTWVDQVHLMLTRLGFGVPDRPALQHHYESAPACDDDRYLASMGTARIGLPGWASWDYAYDSRDDCTAEGFREIAGHWVSCTPGWGCWNRSNVPVRPSDVAEAAAGSHVTILMNWINDMKQMWSGYACFNHTPLDRMTVVKISLVNVRRIIRTIHARDPDVLVLVMANYPDAADLLVNRTLLPSMAAANAAMKKGLEGEPNTVFVEYEYPLGQELYQTLHPGHPNCRGDRLIAAAAVEAMFRANVISRGPALADSAACLANAACESLPASCCQRSALCWLDYAGQCSPYGPGRQGSG